MSAVSDPGMSKSKSISSTTSPNNLFATFSGSGGTGSSVTFLLWWLCFFFDFSPIRGSGFLVMWYRSNLLNSSIGIFSAFSSSYILSQCKHRFLTSPHSILMCFAIFSVFFCISRFS